METNWNQLIERYLQNELSPEGREAFENELSTNKQLQQELDLHKLVQEAAKRSGQRAQIKNIGKKYHFQKRLKWGSVLLGIAALAVAAALYFGKNDVELKEKNSESALKEQEQGLFPTKSFSQLPTELFQWTGKDTVFISESGVLLSVTENSLDLNEKPYHDNAIIQWQEARDPSDIMKEGLSTTSDGKLLETQGMFGFQAVTPDGKKLTVNPKEGVYVQVPVDKVEDGMLLFTGEKDKKGQVNWVEPVALEKLPVRAKMSELDFYPSGYEAELNAQQWNKTKLKRDSLYLSFEEVASFSSVEKEDSRSFKPSSEPQEKTKNNIPIVVTESSNNGSSKINTNFISATSSNTNNKVTFEVSTQRLKGNQLKVIVAVNVKKGWVIFPSEPELNKVNPNLRTKLSFNSTSGFKKMGELNSKHNQLVTSDFYGNLNIATISGTASFSQIIEMQRAGNLDLSFTFNYFLANETSVVASAPERISLQYFNSSSALEPEAHIPPSKVLAIWQAKFENTILATRDFEKRMKAIHATCSNDVFTRYVNQLNQPLWVIDEQVAKSGHPEFYEFARERVGKIELDNGHMNNLRQFYAHSREKLSRLAKENQEAQRKKDLKFDSELRKSTNKQNANQASRNNLYVNQLLGVERTNNRIVAEIKQIASRAQIGFMLRPTVSERVNQTPLTRNVDKYSEEQLAYFRAKEARRAEKLQTKIIEETSCFISVSDFKKYDRLFLYVLRSDKNSFQRFDAVQGEFTGDLRGEMAYTYAIIGQNENGYFTHILPKTVKDVTEKNLELNAVTEAQFKAQFSALTPRGGGRMMNMEAELSWLKLELQNYTVKKERVKMKAFRSKLETLVYPCLKMEADSTSVEVEQVETINF